MRDCPVCQAVSYPWFQLVDERIRLPDCVHTTGGTRGGSPDAGDDGCRDLGGMYLLSDEAGAFVSGGVGLAAGARPSAGRLRREYFDQENVQRRGSLLPPEV